MATAGYDPALLRARYANTMGQKERDLEKGEAEGTRDALDVLEAILDQIGTILGTSR